jgi:hypothetical protein
MNRKLAVKELKETFAVLNADVEEIKRTAGESLTAFDVRSMIRTFSALMEGLLYQMRQVALHSDAHNEIYSTQELMILRGESLRLNNKGKIEVQPSYEGALNMLLFTFNQFPKIHGAKFSANTGVHGWGSMRELVGIRNRITHPKSKKDLELSESEWEEVIQGMDWFHNTVRDMFKACDEADEYIRLHGVLPSLELKG